MTHWCQDAIDGVHVQVRVIANAAADEVVGVFDNELKVKVTAQPERGQANKRVIELLSSFFDVSPRDINCERGTTSPHKLFCIRGIDAAACARRIQGHTA